MYTVQRSALVQHSARDMSILVNDVDRYAEFLPRCGGSNVVARTDDTMIATVVIAFKGVKKSFTTKNEIIGHEQTKMSLVDGPFQSLSGGWAFKPLDKGASKISLNLEFDFSNPLVAKVIGPVFKRIADSMVESFCKRADELYRDRLD